MTKRLKNNISSYAFEVSVIFIGITLSFLFEEWRTNRDKAQIIKTHLIGIREESILVNRIISIYDSSVRAEILLTDSLISRKALENKEAFELLRLSISNRDFSILYKLRELSTLKATGDISLINRDIVTMLELVQVAADKIEGARYDIILFDQLVKEVIYKTHFVSDKRSKTLTTDYSGFIKSNSEVAELISWRIEEKRIPLYNLGLLKERCDELVSLVDEEIRKY